MNGKAYRVGQLELISLTSLRERIHQKGGLSGRLSVSAVTGDVRKMHQAPENAGATFQVASQFNLLEMISPDVTPNDGVGRYEYDPTQGPACAIAAGAATIYRNYFAPVDGQVGQTAERQIDGLSDVGAALSGILEMPVDQLWEMRNGYALCSEQGLCAINQYLQSLSPEKLDYLRRKLKVGVHSGVEVTDSRAKIRPVVSQVFCSALPVAYSEIPTEKWAPFASLVLEAAYEATLLAALLNKESTSCCSPILVEELSEIKTEWITSAIRRALLSASNFDLKVKIVSHNRVSGATSALVDEFR